MSKAPAPLRSVRTDDVRRYVLIAGIIGAAFMMLVLMWRSDWVGTGVFIGILTYLGNELKKEREAYDIIKRLHRIVASSVATDEEKRQARFLLDLYEDDFK